MAYWKKIEFVWSKNGLSRAKYFHKLIAEESMAKSLRVRAEIGTLKGVVGHLVGTNVERNRDKCGTSKGVKFRTCEQVIVVPTANGCLI